MDRNLSRFREAQERSYSIALEEIRRGRKNSHWMWYIFPQLKGLGKSYTSEFYGIEGLEEARAYWADPVLGGRLVEISEALLNLNTNNATFVFGRPDDMKLKSSMTLFAAAVPECEVFGKVLEKFFGGKADVRTLRMLGMKP